MAFKSMAHAFPAVRNTPASREIASASTADGQQALPNSFGVYVSGYVNSNQVTHEINDLLVGGTAPSAGNLISGNTNAGVYVFGPGARGVTIQGNLVGTDIDGGDALPNGFGVLIRDASGVRVGGGSEEERNVISGNNGDGVHIERGSNNVVAGNYIGTAADGMSALRNNGAGVHVFDSSDNIIGGVEVGRKECHLRQ